MTPTRRAIVWIVPIYVSSYLLSVYCVHLGRDLKVPVFSWHLDFIYMVPLAVMALSTRMCLAIWDAQFATRSTISLAYPRISPILPSIPAHSGRANQPDNIQHE